MRRDHWRVGIGRLLLEGALGVALVHAASESERLLAVCLALAAAMIAHLTPKTRRRAFVAAHVALAAAAIPPHLGTAFATPLLAAGLGASIELTHLDFVERRRLHENVRTLRVPSSLLMRRLGSVVVIAVLGRITSPLAALSARPAALAPLLIVLATLALLAAGFGAGPGRPVTRPIDAAIFVLLAILLAISP